MTLTDEELDNFIEGEFYHCNELAMWDSCDEHEECSVAICMECKNSWCDTSEGF